MRNQRVFRLLLTLPLAATLMLSSCRPTTVPTDAPVASYILIDPGHGGADGGAVSVTGVLEKEINLAIARPTADLLTLFGYRALLTRTTDCSLHEAGISTLRAQKVSDLRTRLALYQGAQLAVAIHQNYYSVEKYSGTQLFYGTRHADSAALAEALRQAVTASLQPENTRRSKEGKGVYLLERAVCPAVFVECGFLSNRAEESKLNTPAYQRQMALTVATGIFAFLAK